MLQITFVTMILLFSSLSSFTNSYVCRLEHYENISKYEGVVKTNLTVVFFDDACIDKKPSYTNSMGSFFINISCQDKKFFIHLKNQNQEINEVIDRNRFFVFSTSILGPHRSGLKISCENVNLHIASTSDNCDY